MSGKTTSSLTSVLRIFEDWYFYKPFKIIDFFRDRVGEISFMCFISYSGECYEALENYRKWLEQVLLAEIFIIDPNLILSLSFHQVFYDPVIRSFWEKSDYLKELLHKHKKLNDEGIFHQDINTYLNAICSIPPFNFLVGAIQNFIQKPLLFAEAWAEAIWDIIVSSNYDIISATQKILDKFNSHAKEAKAFRLPQQLLIVICPWIAYIVPQILASIRLAYAYSKVEPKKGKLGVERNVFKNLLAELYINKKYVDSVIPLSSGDIIFTMKKAEYEKMEPKEIMIDVMGLKTTYLVKPPEFPRLQLYDSHTNLWIPCKEGDRCKVIKEEDIRENYVCTYVFEESYDWDWNDAKVIVLDEDKNWHLEIYKGDAMDPHRWYYDNIIIVDLPSGHRLPYELFAHVIVDKKEKNIIHFWRE
jgi:hypothetical protein